MILSQTKSKIGNAGLFKCLLHFRTAAMAFCFAYVFETRPWQAVEQVIQVPLPIAQVLRYDLKNKMPHVALDNGPSLPDYRNR